MGAQDNLEKVLREIHVLISRSELYDKTGEKIIVEKKQMFEQLNKLNACIYEMMDEYEVTKQSRDRGEREAKKQADQIIWKASRNAEDVYAAAVLYTDDALVRANEIMAEAEASIQELLQKTQEEMATHRQVLKDNQSELKSQLQDMVDTEKYLKIIEERNRELEKEKQEKAEGKDVYVEEKKQEKSIYEGRQTEVKVNQEYLRKLGYAVDEDEEEEKETEEEMLTLEEEEALLAEEKASQVKVDPDAEIFRWIKGRRKS